MRTCGCPDDTPVVKANNVIKDEFVKYGHTMILVQADDIRTPEVLGAMAEIQEGVENVPRVVAVSSIASLLNQVPDDKNVIEHKIAALPFDLRRQYVINDYTKGLMLIKIDGEMDGNELVVLLEEIKDVLDYVEMPGDVVFVPAGMDVVGSQIEEIMDKDKVQSVLLSLVLVIILLFLALRSFMGIILALLPVLLTIIFAMGTMGFLGIPEGFLTLMIPTLL
ncbi:putative exporter protein, RND superfamily, partial [Candidatus Methanophagaceae archaeon]